MITTPTSCGFKSSETLSSGKTIAVEAATSNESASRCYALILEAMK